MYFTVPTRLTIENDQSKQKGRLGFFFVAVAYIKLMLFFFPRSNSAKEVFRVRVTRSSHRRIWRPPRLKGFPYAIACVHLCPMPE